MPRVRLRAFARRHPASVGFAAGVLSTAVVGTTTVAVAAIPDAQGVVHACVTIPSGVTRIIDTAVGGSCLASERGVSWSQTGPRGPQGLPGAPGAQGAKGDTGPAGAGIGTQLAHVQLTPLSFDYGSTTKVDTYSTSADGMQVLYQTTFDVPQTGFVQLHYATQANVEPDTVCPGGDTQSGLDWYGGLAVDIGRPAPWYIQDVTSDPGYHLDRPQENPPLSMYLTAGTYPLRVLYKPAYCPGGTPSGKVDLSVADLLLVRAGL